MAIDISDDYAIFDNTEAVSLKLKRNAGDVYVYVRNALRGRVNRDEPNRLDGYLQTDSLSFFVPHDQIAPNKEIEPGDTIKDEDGTTYTVLRAGRVQMGNSHSGWRCTVTPER